jgi:anaerobic selenocysteine-containing dehydrogenase
VSSGDSKRPPLRGPLSRLAGLLHRSDGPLTRELRLVEAPGLGLLPERLAPESTVASVCGFCSTGCALDVHLRAGRAVHLTPSRACVVNRGNACPKGWEALAVLRSGDRAVEPLLRRRPGGPLEPVEWEAAIRAFCDRVRAIQQRYGPQAVAFIGSGQLPTEEIAFLGALAKFGMGMLHGDANTRQCMATSVAAYRQSFGFDAPPYTYGDLEESDAVILVGSNLCIAHPILWERLLRNRRRPEIVIVDPRHTETAVASTRHIALRPKSDLTLFYAVGHILAREGWIDRAFIDEHTAGFGDFLSHLQSFPPRRAAEECGVSEGEVEALAELIGRSERVSFWWTMGVNQGTQAVRTAQSLIALALMTGNIGKPGTGANSITGQCNAMGSRLFSNTSSLFCGREFEDAAARRQVARILGIAEERIPAQPSWSYDRIVEGIRRGEIRGLWIAGTNPAHSWIDRCDLERLFSRLELLVVQDMYLSAETARRADLLLPAAGWGEKEGTFINSERRIGRIRRVSPPPGSSLPDFEIFRLLADAWGAGGMFRRWRDPEAVFDLLRELSRGRPCDFSGTGGYGELERRGGVQWPCPEGMTEPAAERRLFEDGRFFHPDGRARFLFTEASGLAEPTCPEYPFLLLTGRGSAAQWHTQTRSGKSAVLRALAPAGPYVEVHPMDAARAGVVSGDRVRLESRRGAMEAAAFVTACAGAGQLFVPMHYEEVNRLTLAHFDPYSRQPAYKDCAVRLVALAAGRGGA